MQRDFGWQRSALAYLDIYRRALAVRRNAASVPDTAGTDGP
jgi:glycogen synthase